MGKITKTVMVKWNPANRKWYESKGYIFTKWKDEFEVKAEDLSNGANVYVDIQCDGCCEILRNIKWRDYLRYVHEDNKYYCKKCALKLVRIEKNLNWSIELINELLKDNEDGQKVINKTYKNNSQKLTLIDKFGYLYFQRLDSIRNKIIPSKFNISNPYTIHNIKLWCRLNNKPFKLLPRQIYKGNDNSLKLQWQCLKSECGEIFNASWAEISQGNSCSFCHGTQVGLSNCLATKRPDLIDEWHPTLNKDLTPWDVTYGSAIEVWWQCSKNPKHEWHTPVSNRASSNTGCPYCSHSLPSEDYNLLVCNPEVASEWNYEKNDKRPEDYTPGSIQYAWWKCRDCNNEWYTQISTRNGEKGSGCPECAKSKGEKRISNNLLKNNWVIISKQEFNKMKEIDKYNNNYFIPQKTFKDLKGLGNNLLSYDFYIPRYNLLIEYQGEQHEKYIPYFYKTIKDFERQIEHDKRKRNYAEKNKINLLEIWYYDFNNIEEILTNYFKELSNNQGNSIRKEVI